MALDSSWQGNQRFHEEKTNSISALHCHSSPWFKQSTFQLLCFENLSTAFSTNCCVIWPLPRSFHWVKGQHQNTRQILFCINKKKKKHCCSSHFIFKFVRFELKFRPSIVITVTPNCWQTATCKNKKKRNVRTVWFMEELTTEISGEAEDTYFKTDPNKSPWCTASSLNHPSSAADSAIYRQSLLFVAFFLIQILWYFFIGFTACRVN